MDTIEYLKKEQIGYFVQVRNRSSNDIFIFYNPRFSAELIEEFGEMEGQVNVGHITRDKDNLIHIWKGNFKKELNRGHLEDYFANKNLKYAID